MLNTLIKAKIIDLYARFMTSPLGIYLVFKK